MNDHERELFESVWAGAPVGLILVSCPPVADFTLTRVNEYARGLGILTDAQGEKDNDKGQEHTEDKLVLDPDVAHHVRAVWRSGEERAVDMKIRIEREHQGRINVHLDIRPIGEDAVVIYATDESENVRMEAARRDFVANVSHELKTPVGGMSLLAEALIASADDPEQVIYFGERIVKEAGRMGALISELISLSKLQGAAALPELYANSAADIINQAIARNTDAAENAGIELVAEGLQQEPVWILADSGLLATALSNLIVNAINYSPEDTTVRISLEADENDVSIAIADEGLGIAPKYHARVFERFFRVDKARSRSTGGTGLGLAIVKHAIALHNGTISLESELGEGTTFTVTLPRISAEEAEAHREGIECES
ncbi:MAG: ATP-binding protein [Corynebacterium sp.]|nr:ATP-binding protein [Corynebacterium sp.]